uniref:Ribonuclease A-domain domain-containing protein n=1 Tax=Gopherus agassizii TaxID=38772 RepID=A0A452GHC7_9SAUR
RQSSALLQVCWPKGRGAAPSCSATSNIHEICCNYMMKELNMTCKRINTFIHAPEEDIKAICKKKGILDKDSIYKSNTTLNLTLCKLKTQNAQSCTYEEEEKTSKIRVACNKDPCLGIDAAVDRCYR